MSLKNRPLDLTETQLQGMMMGQWEPRTQFDISDGYTIVCLDGEVWEIQDDTQNVIRTINPTAVATDSNFVQILRDSIGESR